MADATDLKSVAFGRAGSSPAIGISIGRAFGRVRFVVWFGISLKNCLVDEAGPHPNPPPQAGEGTMHNWFS